MLHTAPLMSGIVQFWSLHSCGWLNVKWPSSIWSLWVIRNKQMIFEPCLWALRGRPVIGCNPVLLSSPDGRKWERRVSVDNGYTEMLYKSLSPTHIRIYIQTPRCLWCMTDYCGRLAIVLLPAQSLIPLSYPCFRSPDLHAGQVCTFEPPSGATVASKVRWERAWVRIPAFALNTVINKREYFL